MTRDVTIWFLGARMTDACALPTIGDTNAIAAVLALGPICTLVIRVMVLVVRWTAYTARLHVLRRLLSASLLMPVVLVSSLMTCVDLRSGIVHDMGGARLVILLTNVVMCLLRLEICRRSLNVL